MKTRFLFFLLSLLVLYGNELSAQCISNSYHTLDVNHVSGRFSNSGEQFWNHTLGTKYFVPRASGKSPVFAQGLWIGGLGPQGQLHVAASSYRQAGAEFYSGPYRNPVTSCQTTLVTPTKVFRNGLKRLSNGKVLLLDSTQVTIYDPVTSQVTARAWPQTRGWVDALELADGRVLIFGDELYPNKIPVLYMDTVNYNFTTGPTLTWFHKESTANQLLDGRVLLAGVVSCETLDPTNNTTTPVLDMLYPRMKHAAVRLPNGNVMAFGGGASLNGTGYTLKTQYFDDSLGYWLPGPDMQAGRNNPDVVQLQNGNYLITGGTMISGLCEVYDPIADSIFAGPLLVDAVMENNSVLLPNGNVLLAQQSSTPQNSNLNMLDITTSQVASARIEALGPQLVMLGPDEALVAWDDSRHFQRILLNGFHQVQNPWQYIWKLDRSQIDQFRADFLASTVDFAQYPDIETWPAHGDVGAGEDRNLAPFVDVNLDGLYRPADDGDYPCIVGDQALWWVFNDQGIHHESKGLPMGLQIEAMAYAFDCSQTNCPDTSLDYATFLHYEITNHSDTAWSDMYVGGYYDVDIGGWSDDFIGCDSSLSLAFGYNGDDNDEGATGYGMAPPAWGAVVLPNGGQLASMTGFMESGYSFPSTFNSLPSAPEDYYNYLRSRWRDSLHLVNNGSNGYPGSASGPVTNYMYSSTQGFCGGFLTGWSELTSGSTASDRHFLQSSGPVTLQPGESVHYDLAFPYARDSNHTKSVCALKDATAAIQSWWQTQLDRSCFSISVGRKEPLLATGFKIVPNPVMGGVFSVELGQPLGESAALDVLDLNGRIVVRGNMEVGAENFVVDASRLPAGVYLVRLSQASGIRTQRVVIW